MTDAIKGWSMWTEIDVAHTGMLCEEQLLPPEYQSEKKEVMPFWAYLFQFVRKNRSVHGCFKGRHQQEINALAFRYFHGRYVPLPPWWQKLELPREFWAPLWSTFWYVGSRLMEDANYPIWLLVVTQWIFSVADYLV